MWCTPAWVHAGGTEPGMLLMSEADTCVTFTVAILSEIYCLRSTVVLEKIEILFFWPAPHLVYFFQVGC